MQAPIVNAMISPVAEPDAAARQTGNADRRPAARQGGPVAPEARAEPAEPKAQDRANGPAATEAGANRNGKTAARREVKETTFSKKLRSAEHASPEGAAPGRAGAASPRAAGPGVDAWAFPLVMTRLDAAPVAAATRHPAASAKTGTRPAADVTSEPSGKSGAAPSPRPTTLGNATKGVQSLAAQKVADEPATGSGRANVARERAAAKGKPEAQNPSAAAGKPQPAGETQQAADGFAKDLSIPGNPAGRRGDRTEDPLHAPAKGAANRAPTNKTDAGASRNTRTLHPSASTKAAASAAAQDSHTVRVVGAVAAAGTVQTSADGQGDASLAQGAAAAPASATATPQAGRGGVGSPGALGQTADMPVTDQIAQSVRSSGVGLDRQVIIRLSPPDLGQVRVTLRASGNRVRGVLEVDNPETLRRLEREAGVLTQRLQEAGLQVKRMDVVLVRQDGGPTSENPLTPDGRRRGPEDEPAKSRPVGSPRRPASLARAAESDASGPGQAGSVGVINVRI
jgi:flagellar hook-length control protein FliK